MSNIQLKDNQQQYLYPITKSENVKFNDGLNLDEKLANVKTTVTWNDIESKPSTFTPSEHTHNYVDDNSTSSTTTWSSNKIKSSLGSKAEIMDGNESNQYTWSGEYIANNYASSGHTHAEYAPTSHTHSASSITSGTISKDRLPIAYGDRQNIGICYLDANANNNWHSGEAVGAHASAVKTVYDMATSAQTKANSAYTLANHSHPYASSSHTHSNYASSSHTHDRVNCTSNSSYGVEAHNGYVYFKAGSSTIRLDNGTNQSSSYGGAYKLVPTTNGVDLGSGTNTWTRWRTIFSQNALNVSDVKHKENIQYLDDNMALYSNSSINTPFLDFIKNDFKPATYMYKAMREEEGHVEADRQIGFIANDIINSEVGKTFLYNFGTEEDTNIMYSPTGYTTVVAKALQEEIGKREELENRLLVLEEKLSETERTRRNKNR